MGNSTVKLQDVADFVSTMGDVAAVIPVGGFSTVMAFNIANAVMNELLSERFNWKWNRIQVAPFLTNSLQPDYANVSLATVGWLEDCAIVDINNTTALRKPIYWLECKRDLARSSFQFGRPAKICWLPNDQMETGVWPGAGVTYANPLGALVTPSNPLTNILDPHGNILVLTTFGVTGLVTADAGANAVVGATVNDGTCVWTVANPKAQGFRIWPVPPQTGLVYQVNPVAQMRPVRFTSMRQTLDPIPDDYSNWFQDGFIAYAHRHSPAPAVRGRFEEMKRNWLEAIIKARGQGDRERDDAGFIPDRGIMDQTSNAPIGPANPFGPFS